MADMPRTRYMTIGLPGSSLRPMAACAACAHVVGISIGTIVYAQTEPAVRKIQTSVSRLYPVSFQRLAKCNSISDFTAVQRASTRVGIGKSDGASRVYDRRVLLFWTM